MITGARHLPPHHITIRVPWHDGGWTGSVCSRPLDNTSCLILPSRGPLSTLRRNQWFQLGDEHWKVAVYRLPYEAQVDVEIGVYESITHSYDFSPRDIRMPLLGFGTQVRCCFSNDLHRLENGELTPSVLS